MWWSRYASRRSVEEVDEVMMMFQSVQTRIMSVAFHAGLIHSPGHGPPLPAPSPNRLLPAVFGDESEEAWIRSGSTFTTIISTTIITTTTTMYHHHALIHTHGLKGKGVHNRPQI